MKKSLQKILVSVFVCGCVSSLSAQTRYLDEVFTNVTVTTNVQYGQNISVLSGAPLLSNLVTDVYEPTGDTALTRPIIIYLHTGSFLPPPINGQCTGDKSDSAAVEMCSRFAKKGYVVFNANYRMGWNPISPDQDVRTSTLINAAYRGVQDAKSLVRYIRSTVATMSNPYKVDDTRIVIGGQGTGGYVALAYATLDSYADITLTKLLNLTTGNPYIDTSLSGDWDGYGGTVLNAPALNNPGYSTAINMVFNMGGALGDSSWLDTGNVPIVCFHVPNDPFAPYYYGPVIVPTTGQFVINVSGSYDIVRRSNYLGNNDILKIPTFTDPITAIANTINDGYEGLYPLLRPVPPPPSPIPGEAGPWEWWDTTCTNHASGLFSNPDMSKTKAMAYIDTCQSYLAPRLCRVLGFGYCGPVGIQEYPLQNNVAVYPNPASEMFTVDATSAKEKMLSLQLYSIAGSLVLERENLNDTRTKVDTRQLSKGMYFLKLTFEKGYVIKKITVQ